MRGFCLIVIFLISSFIVNAQFGPQNIINAITGLPYSIKEADMDGDGDVDIVVSSDPDGKITWYENDGNGELRIQHIVAKDLPGPLYIFVADLDNDNDYDIVSASFQSGEIGWHQNLGNNHFSPRVVLLDLPVFARSVYAADIDADGDVDIFASTASGIYGIENLGLGIFSQQYDTIGTGHQNMAVIDIDGDNDLDVITQANNQIIYYENIGGGILDTINYIGTSTVGLYAVQYVDIDNDGDIDVVASINAAIFLYENLGGGIFTSSQQITNNSGGGTSTIFVKDIDGDMELDILVNSISTDELGWFENLGGTTFSSFNSILTQVNVNSLLAYDVGQNGSSDIIVGYTSTSSPNKYRLELLKGFGGGSFSSPFGIANDHKSISSVKVADIDADGNLDVLVTSQQDYKIAWYKNLGGGDFTSQKIITEYDYDESSIDLIDLDGDLDLDILMTMYGADSIAWLENLGSGIINPTLNILSTSLLNPVQAQGADLDGDGDIDIVTASSGDNKIGWFQNLGGGTFGSQILLGSQVGAGEGGMFLYDIDNDGDIDIVSAGSSIEWWENLGAGSFAAKVTIVSGLSSNLSSLNYGDLNNDGLVDLITTASGWFENSILSYQNLGGGFGVPDTIAILQKPRSAKGVDIDGDGDVDVVASSFTDDEIVWFENLGANMFGPSQLISTDYQYCMNIGIGDIDNDGDIDIVPGSWGDDKVGWHENYFLSPYQLKGKMFYDANQNGNIDSNDYGISIGQIQLQPNGVNSYSNSQGVYYFTVDTGSCIVSFTPQSNWNLTTDSLTFSPSITALNPIKDSLDFGFYPTNSVTDLEPVLTGFTSRCNTLVNYWININNIGTTTPSGVIHLELDNEITYNNSAFPPDSINGQHIYWSYDSLQFFQNVLIPVYVTMPGGSSSGNLFSSYLSVHELNGGGNIIYTSIDALSGVFTCSFDPNDKAVTPKGLGTEGYIAPEINLEYLIRFQNTGNDTALTVMVRDQLDADLDWNSLHVLASSHPMQTTISNSGKVTFKFDNIMLPDSGADQLASNGFVKFRINQKQNLPKWTEIHNTGHIYFDLNAPVITNTVVNTIYYCDSTYMDIARTNYCLGDELISFSNEGFPYNNYTWEIDAFFASTLDTLNWLSDTVGTFNLKMTINNQFCSKDTIVAISVLSEIPVANSNQTVCQGDSILLYGLYQNSVGVYYDSLQTINGCDSILSTTLTIDPLPNVSITDFNPDTICVNSSSPILPNGTPSGGSYSGIGVAGTNFDPLLAGVGSHDIIYTYADGNSCVNSDTTIITVDLCTGIDDISSDFGILIYPNPSTGLFTIEKPSDLNTEVQIRVLDATSKLIVEKVIPLGKQKIEVDITACSSGLYYLQLIVEEEVFVKQILKK